MSGVLQGSYQAGQSFGAGLSSLRLTTAMRVLWMVLFAHAVIHLIGVFL